jgi:heme-binding protein
MRKVAVVLGALLVGAQFIRFDHQLPAAGQGPAAPPEVEAVLHRACYDCHSNQPQWPWYGNVAPVSWLLQRDVDNGRRRLNFSEWDAYASDPETARHKLEEIRTAMAGEDMAPWYYRLLHPGARLTAAQRDVVIRWTEQAGDQPPPSR